MTEEWRDIYFTDKGVIYDYRGLYWVSNLGKVKAKASVTNQYHKKGEVYEIKYRYNRRKHNKNGGLGGYCIVALYNKGKRRDVQLHRIVANMFIPNPNNLPQVNHKDGNKLNNVVNINDLYGETTNLEWCNNSYNQIEAYRLGLHKKKTGKEHVNSKPILQYDLQGNFLKEWECITEAQKYYANGKTNCISMCLRNKCKTAYGYKWKYKEMV